MAKAVKSALAAITKIVPGNSARLSCIPKQSGISARYLLGTSALSSPNTVATPRAHSTLSTLRSRHTKGTSCSFAHKQPIAFYSTEVDKEISSFLDKEIQFETSRSSDDLPKVSGFEVTTEGGDITLTKSKGSEKVIVRLSVNGAVDSVIAESAPEKQDEPPQMVCRPPFEVEISKGDGTVLALQCVFPSADEPFEDAEQYSKGDQEADRIEDQFEIQEVALHSGEWKDTTFSVSAATMDAELFDLLMDMLDERGVNDEFISQLVEYCTAYENKQYIGFLKGLKTFAEK
ncbi:conserved regulator of innate immunity protein 3 [Aplysia californica]|uniref:Conserved regulator of innate immunity protein 3 n=1 Tax=Aplysia californica TaxID=6500 RepID=A0ABM0JHD1_APLCA|nr:conserved regulator of innate immunity protein 3 [Aplysia californica]